MVPFYDRSSLIAVTTHTVLHNLIFGFLLVFLIQWIFLGNLRSAIIVGLNIPFALFFATILLVIRGESANLLSVGAVDFGIIVDSAVILVENVFRNLQRDPAEKDALLERLSAGSWGPDPTRSQENPAQPLAWTDRMRLILISAMQVDKAVLFSTLITVAGFVPLFTMQGVEGQIFGPMARTYGYALAGALIATFTITPPLASVLLPEHIKEAETIFVRLLHWAYNPALRFALNHRFLVVAIEIVVTLGTFLVIAPGSEANFFPIWRKAISGFAPPCRSRFLWKTARRPQEKCAKFFFDIRKSSPSSLSTAGPTTAATPRHFPMSNCSRR